MPGEMVIEYTPTGRKILHQSGVNCFESLTDLDLLIQNARYQEERSRLEIQHLRREKAKCLSS